MKIPREFFKTELWPDTDGLVTALQTEEIKEDSVQECKSLTEEEAERPQIVEEQKSLQISVEEQMQSPRSVVNPESEYFSSRSQNLGNNQTVPAAVKNSLIEDSRG